MAERILFGEFLVQKGLLSAQTVLGLLIEQIHSQPSVAEVVYTNKLLNESQQLQVLRVQSRTGWDYQQGCVELKYWSDQLASTVVQKSCEGRPPLGQLIVAKGLMSFGDLTKVLDEFVGMCETDGAGAISSTKAPPGVSSNLIEGSTGASAVEAPQAPVDLAPATMAAVTIAPAATMNKPVSLSEDGIEPKLQSIDRMLLDEFMDGLSENGPAEVASMTSSWSLKLHDGETDLVVNDLLKLAKDWDSVQAAARFVRAELIGRIMHQGVTALRAVAANEEVLISSVTEVSAACTSVVNVIGTLREILAAERSEKSMWNVPEHRSAFFEATGQLQALFAKTFV
jgi:hypothetical protein